MLNYTNIDLRKRKHAKINWKALPFIRFLFPLILGIYLAEKLAVYHYLLNFCLFLSFFSLYYFKSRLPNYSRRWVPGLAINFFLFLFGYQLTYYQNHTHHTQHFQETIQRENYIVGIVDQMPSIKNDKIKVVIATQMIADTTNLPTNCQGKLLVYLDDYENAPKVKYGDQILFKAKILALEKPKNPYAFDYGQYLYFKNIHYQSFVYQKNWKILVTNQGNIGWSFIYSIRNHCLNVLHQYILSEKEVAIATALILGYKENLSQDLKIAYSESGAIHVLAVSGLHVGIISSFLLFLLNLFSFKNPLWNWIKLGLILVCIWCFAFLTGFSASVQRAAIMFSVLNISLVLQRIINQYNSLAIAAFLILIQNPYALFDVGFQFSFLAVLGIFFFSPKIRQVWKPKSKILFQIWALTVVSISAQLTVFPLVIYYFHQLPTYFWLSGLFVIPLAGILMKLGISLLFISSFSEFIASYLGLFISKIIAFQNQLIHYIQTLPFNVIIGFWINQWEVLLFYGFVFGVAMLLLTYQIRWIMVAFSCLLLVSCIQLSTTFHQIHQKQIIIYSLAQKSVVDFVDGQTVYSVFDDQIPNSQLVYAVQNSRWALGANQIISIDKLVFQDRNLFRKGTLFQFYNRRLVVLNQALSKNIAIKKQFNCDYVLIQNNPTIDIETLVNYYNFKKIIFDNSNSRWAVKKWKASCDILGIPYKDIKNEGSFFIDLDP